MDTLPESVTMGFSRCTDASTDDVAVAAGNSGSRQNAAQTAALCKLSEGGYNVVNLLQVREEPLWGEIRTKYQLSFEELLALKNYACSARTQLRRVLPLFGGDRVLYRINDDRIRSKFTISNVLVPPHRYTLNAELLVDSGANTELKISARKVLQLGLRPFGHPSRSCGSTNNICYTMNFNPVLVKAHSARNGVEAIV